MFPLSREEYELRVLTNALRALSPQATKKTIIWGRVAVIIGMLTAFLAYILFEKSILSGSWWGGIALIAGYVWGTGTIWVKSGSDWEFWVPYIDASRIQKRIEEIET